MSKKEKRLPFPDYSKKDDLPPHADYGDGTMNFFFILLFIVIVALMAISA